MAGYDYFLAPSKENKLKYKVKPNNLKTVGLENGKCFKEKDLAGRVTHPSHQHEAAKAQHWEAETMLPELSFLAEGSFLTSFSSYVVQWELPLLFSVLPELSDSSNLH